MQYPSDSVLQFYLPGEDTVVRGAGEPHTYEQLVEAARHVAWHYSLGDPAKFHPPGDMLQDIMRAMARADRGNMVRLCRAFPLHGHLMRIVKADDVRGLSMIMNLLDYHGDAWTDRRSGTQDKPDPLCEHGVWQYGACKNADCPNCADNVLPELGGQCQVTHVDAAGLPIPCPADRNRT